MISYINGVVMWDLKQLKDDRGWLMECWRADELIDDDIPDMAYVSMTLPGVSRGPHEHRDQTDLFIFAGPGDFEVHLWEQEDSYKETFTLGESCPMAVLVPPGVIHGYRNISDKPGLVINCPNRLYMGPGKRYKVDEIRHEESSKYSFPEPE
jgi:dTDP-4-dehydrorhamnose 3,5-epimerase